MALYPLKAINSRQFKPDYDGLFFVFDIDKTYLETGLSSIKAMSRVPLELAVDKSSVWGMPEILRGVRRGYDETQITCEPIYFVTASPVELRKILERKMALDGVEYDGIVLKDWVAIFKSLKLKRLTKQIGFKLCALLTLKLEHPLSREVLFGDSYESDPDAYDLYSKIISGEYSSWELDARMKKLEVASYDRRCVFSLFERLPKKLGQVVSVFIRIVNKKGAERSYPHIHYYEDARELATLLYGLKLIDQLALTQLGVPWGPLQ